MSDPRHELQSKFKESCRYDNFGAMLTQLHVQGFRCHADTQVEVRSPITAFCGLNGVGKSTLLQLAAAAYNSPDRKLKPFYIRDFLVVVGTLDPEPFTDHARVEYSYWQRDRTHKTVTLSRDADTKRWQGYQRRPQRQVMFAGVGFYLPRIEHHDFIIRNATRVSVQDQRSVAEQIKRWSCRILGNAYVEMTSNTVTHARHRDEVLSVSRCGADYSEFHMGYGEGRTQHLISTLETLPDQSLVLIEEPETSLHPSAQKQFALYLIDVAFRKCHQILITTHSESILQALPTQSRIYLHRSGTEISPIGGISSLEAGSLLSEGDQKALHILVEDTCAQAILRALIRRYDRRFLDCIGIHPAGDTNLLEATTKALKSTGLPVAVVRDGDTTAQPKLNIYRLPGSLAPEREMWASVTVRQFLKQTYDVDLDVWDARNEAKDHHEWIEQLADDMNEDKAALLAQLASAYIESIGESEAVGLLNSLKAVSDR